MRAGGCRDQLFPRNQTMWLRDRPHRCQQHLGNAMSTLGWIETQKNALWPSNCSPGADPEEADTCLCRNMYRDFHSNKFSQ